uniref:Uncharacterized protein n=1 Tax=Chlamydia pneumoniae TaxID=83558 RepID=A0A0F7WKE6_CHLPN|nr:hypothetical protein BN1224_CV15_B_00010 [Chlamydia pneumoniae]
MLAVSSKYPGGGCLEYSGRDKSCCGEGRLGAPRSITTKLLAEKYGGSSPPTSGGGGSSTAIVIRIPQILKFYPIIGRRRGGSGWWGCCHYTKIKYE